MTRLATSFGSLSLPWVLPGVKLHDACGPLSFTFSMQAIQHPLVPTALVFYSTLTGRNPSGAPAVIKGRPTVVMADGQTNVDPTLKVPLVDLREATAAQLQAGCVLCASVCDSQRGGHRVGQKNLH